MNSVALPSLVRAKAEFPLTVLYCFCVEGDNTHDGLSTAAAVSILSGLSRESHSRKDRFVSNVRRNGSFSKEKWRRNRCFNSTRVHSNLHHTNVSFPLSRKYILWKVVEARNREILAVVLVLK